MCRLGRRSPTSASVKHLPVALPMSLLSRHQPDAARSPSFIGEDAALAKHTATANTTSYRDQAGLKDACAAQQLRPCSGKNEFGIRMALTEVISGQERRASI